MRALSLFEKYLYNCLNIYLPMYLIKIYFYLNFWKKQKYFYFIFIYI